MKRVVSSSIITLLILIAVAAAFLYFRNFKNEGGDPVSAIPADASFFITYHPDSVNLNQLTQLNFWNTLGKTPAFESLKKLLLQVDSTSAKNTAFSQFLHGAPIYISAHVVGASEFDFLFLKSMKGSFTESSVDKLIPELAGLEGEVVTRNYDGNSIREVAVGKRIFTYSISKGIFIGSCTSFIVEDALRQLKVGKPVIDNYGSFSENYQQSGINLFVNFNTLPAFFSVFAEPEKSIRLNNLSGFGKWAASSTEFSNNQINLKGFIPKADSSTVVNCLAGQNPVAKKLLNILPAKTAHVQYYGLSDFNSFYKKLSANYLNQDKISQKKKVTDKIKSNYGISIEQQFTQWIGNEYAFVITEPSGIVYDNNCYAVFRAKNISEAMKSLRSMSKIIDKKSGATTMEEDYNGFPIGLIRLNNILPVMFGDIFTKISGTYYTSIGDYVVFANKASSLRTFIDEYRMGALLVNTEYYKSLKSSLPEAGNVFYMVRPGACFYNFKAVANELWRGYADNFREVINEISNFGFQVNAGPSVHQLNATIQFKSDGVSDGVDQVFAVEADSAIAMAPLLTTDPQSKTRQILFQDESDVLYLADNAGNIIWKQQLSGGGILGKIQEIDLFRNNSRQFLFNTREYMFLLDAEGKPVGNYPIRLPAPATNGLAVYDFDGRNEPRMYVACENGMVYAYVPSGKPLPGWVFKDKTGLVTDEIISVKTGGRDQLIINDEAGNFFVVNRFGETVMPVTSKIVKSKNSGFYTTADSSIIFTDVDGNVVKIKATGSVETIPLNAVSAGHGFALADADADGDDDYVFTNGNELIAYNTNLVMIYRKVFEYELSGSIQIFTLKSGIKVLGLRSESADKTWLVNLNGSPLQGFPVKGSGLAVIDELNLDGNQNLFVGGAENRMYVYTLQ